MEKLKTKKEYVDNLLAAKASGDKAQIIAAITDMLRPEARAAVDAAKKNLTTRDGYSVIMQAAIGCGQFKNLFVDACVAEGYPFNTAQTVIQII